MYFIIYLNVINVVKHTSTFCVTIYELTVVGADTVRADVAAGVISESVRARVK